MRKWKGDGNGGEERERVYVQRERVYVQRERVYRGRWCTEGSLTVACLVSPGDRS